MKRTFRTGLLYTLTGLILLSSTYVQGFEPNQHLYAATHQKKPPTKTAKERLSKKANDEQRVNNCKVPLALRGTKRRPKKCKKILPNSDYNRF